MVEHTGSRRAQNWWEPIYTGYDVQLVPGDWDFKHSTGSCQSFMASDAMGEIPAGQIRKYVNLTFIECDFQGQYRHSPSILFDKCRFENCDFGYSTWYRTTFRECSFANVSFSLTHFEECEFRDCKWHNIAYSGSKTRVIRTFVTEPEKLIAAGYSGLNPIRKGSSEHKAYQSYRLYERKAHMARNLLLSHQDVGDDDTFYRIAQKHDLGQALFHISRGWYKARFGKKNRLLHSSYAIAGLMEYFGLWILGVTNGWGAKLFRPLVLLLICFIIFALQYRFIYHALNPWQTSFDVSIVAGFTSAEACQKYCASRIAIDIQVLISIVFYSMFFSTSIARLSRTR